MIILVLCCCIQTVNAQYITEIFEYTPAPGQFINAAPWGSQILSPQSIVGSVTGSLSLGAFGGYVVFKFANPVENHPDNPFGVDFTIFGNSLPTWSEPGVVSVMKDDNGNGFPDDVWYELAGSDYFFSSTIKNYQTTYYNPNSSSATDVLWSDNLGNSGYIFANTNQTQPYFPMADSFPQINQTQYTLTGTRLENLVDKTDPTMIAFPRRSFGYADNQLRGSAPYTIPDNPYTREKENSGGDAFDISWAVDANGNYVDLESIDFVKVQTAVLAEAGWSGEVSTEITGAVDVEPNAAITGISDIIVIRDLPKSISVPFSMEVFVFHQGRLQQNAEIQWESSLNGVTVDENNLLTFSDFGAVELTCSLVSNPEIFVKVHTVLSENSATEEWEKRFQLFPNPTRGVLTLTTESEKANVSVYNMLGQRLFTMENVSQQQTIDLSDQPHGSYFLKIETQGVAPVFKKIIKQ
ncbi:MAG: T9SS type A sorting domain-containing protein [Bacteroidales bacterium]|nr:T9SS type A sorting domain-containing protein [Bacteroidales bacterium]